MAASVPFEWIGSIPLLSLSPITILLIYLILVVEKNLLDLSK